jgi:hypothetical protein
MGKGGQVLGVVWSPVEKWLLSTGYPQSFPQLIKPGKLYFPQDIHMLSTGAPYEIYLS